VGLRLRDLLDQAGFNYLFTRESDESLSLYDRPAFANDNEADIFVSLHNNSSERSAPKGTEVYYNSKVNEEGQNEEELYGIYSRDIALLVQKEMVAILGTDNRGAKSGEKLAVLNKTSMPAIVVEGAFLSNPEDYALITDDDYCEMYAYAVAKGLITAMNKAF
jgi:N-acetylmuramoyl-L-alanine amidase